MPLPIAHAQQTDVIASGNGRYVHLREKLVFSTSDNSDPRNNDRTYAIAVRDTIDHRFIDPYVGDGTEVVASIPPPRIESPGEDEVVRTARPIVKVESPDPDLLYYWELDIIPSFDSPSLHRRPRTRQTIRGGDPLRILDRHPDFSAEFSLPYRVGAIAPLGISPNNQRFTRIMAARLGYGMPAGHDEIREVFEFVRNQFYPISDDALLRDEGDTWLRDRGFCVATNYLASGLLQSLGYRTRRAQVAIPDDAGEIGSVVSDHSSLEVYYSGQWSIIDPWFDFLLPDTSFADLSRFCGENRYPAIEVVIPGRSLRELLYFEDYARRRRYDQFDNWYIEPADEHAEPDSFSGEPAIVPDPLISDIWPGQMRVWVRVRSVALRAEEVQTWYFPSARACGPMPRTVEASPWSI